MFSLCSWKKKKIKINFQQLYFQELSLDISDQIYREKIRRKSRKKRKREEKQRRDRDPLKRANKVNQYG